MSVRNLQRRAIHRHRRGDAPPASPDRGADARGPLDGSLGASLDDSLDDSLATSLSTRSKARCMPALGVIGALTSSAASKLPQPFDVSS